MFACPASRTGTAQDFLSLVIQAGELSLAREGTSLPSKPPLARALLEPPCILGGVLLRSLLEILPADSVLAFQDRLFRLLAEGRTYQFDAASPVLTRARTQMRALQARAGSRPALVALLSHPPAMGDLGHLNFELARHAAQALRVIRGHPCRPRVVAGVDPFALDTARLPAEGLYAGFMGLYHLGFDRLAFARGACSRLLIGSAAWPFLAGRLLRRLRGGGDVVMALAGGVPATARILYTMREWVAAERRRSPLRGQPAQVLSRLQAWPDFWQFVERGPAGRGLRANAWRMLEGWAMSAAAGHPWNGGGDASCGAESGLVTEQAWSILERCLQALDLPEARRSESRAALTAEWARETPYRARFFRCLAARLLKRGQQIMFLPVVHRGRPRPGVEVREAWVWTGMEAGRIRALQLSRPDRPWQGTAERFAADFGKENFS